MTKTKISSMDDLLKSDETKYGFKNNETIEATIMSRTNNRLYVDIDGRALGIVPAREMSYEAEELKVGDKILGSVVVPEDEQGYMVLSLRRADREKVWDNLEKKSTDEETIAARIVEANKGGLMLETNGLRGFLPVSQLRPEHYPKVEGGNKDKILEKLRSFIGQNMKVKIISFDKENNKLIFSEKQALMEDQKDQIKNLKVGDTVECEISGVVDFGLFVRFEGLEGLIHISEVSWERVTDLHHDFKVGDKVKAEIISLDEGRISLSLKRLLPDPWLKTIKNYKAGDMVKGEVIRVTPFGAFVRLTPEIEGLVHISELTEERVADPREILKVGDKHTFKIISIEKETHRLALSLKQAKEKKASKKK